MIQNNGLHYVVFFFVLIQFLVGCGEKPPYTPRTYYGSAEDTVIRDVKINSVKTNRIGIFNKGKTVAVLSFKSPDKTQGGALVSDIFSLLLQQRGVFVVERDNIKRILNEQKLLKNDGVGVVLSDLEIAKKLGKLISVDYMIFGSVTLYKSEGQVLYLPVHIKQEDRDSYTKDYNRYRDWYLTNGDWWPFSASKEDRIKKLRSVEKILSIAELEEEFGKISKTEFRTIAAIGISAKIVDVNSTKIDWMGQGETIDFTLVQGANRILDKFMVSMKSKNNMLASHDAVGNSNYSFRQTNNDLLKYLTTSSFSVKNRAAVEAKKLSKLGYDSYVFRTKNKQFAVAIGPFSKIQSSEIRAKLISKRKIRKDSYTTDGKEYDGRLELKYKASNRH